LAERSGVSRKPLADPTGLPSGVSDTARVPNHSTADAANKPYSQSAKRSMKRTPMIFWSGIYSLHPRPRRIYYLGVSTPAAN